MVCASKAANEIDATLGETAVVSQPTWVNHLYSCVYRYHTGQMVLSVKELSGWPQTLDYFKSLGVELKRDRTLYNLGQGAFQTEDGSVVVRKDWKVLTVDVAGLPAEFGSPAALSSNAALTVAGAILGCWHGD